MAATFNSLPEAQSYAKLYGLTKYWRVRFTDTDTLTMLARGKPWKDLVPSQKIFMDLHDALDCIEKRANGTYERTEIETLWTADVSDSLAAQ